MLRLIVSMFAKNILQAVMPVGMVSSLNLKAAWSEGLTGCDDNVALNFPFFFLIRVVLLEIGFLSTFSGTAMILYRSIPHLHHCSGSRLSLLLPTGAPWQRTGEIFRPAVSHLGSTIHTSPCESKLGDMNGSFNSLHRVSLTHKLHMISRKFRDVAINYRNAS